MEIWRLSTTAGGLNGAGKKLRGIWMLLYNVFIFFARLTI
jgi:hypothetical protein